MKHILSLVCFTSFYCCFNNSFTQVQETEAEKLFKVFSDSIDKNGALIKADIITRDFLDLDGKFTNPLYAALIQTNEDDEAGEYTITYSWLAVFRKETFELVDYLRLADCYYYSEYENIEEQEYSSEAFQIKDGKFAVGIR